MKANSFILTALFVLTFAIGYFANQLIAYQKYNKSTLTTQTTKAMKLGAFSASLSVKNLQVSKDFYEKLGFNQFAGSMEHNYLIMKNENALIGLFQGMFEGNILTFNPGWDENAQNLSEFDDIREIQRQLKESGVTLTSEVDKPTGPASVTLTDPDGNMILIDQHR